MKGLHVVFRVGAADYVLPAADVLQMESYGGVTPVPGLPPFVAGIVQVRGRVIPLLDLRARFGLPAAASEEGRRIVVAQHKSRAVGLLVDSAREVLQIPPESFGAAPQVVAGAAEGLVKAVAHVGQRLFLLLDFAQLIGEEVLDGAQVP